MKKYEELTFTDDFMFCKILTNNPELCHELLELILGKKVGAFTRLDKQKPIEITADGKGVRFDVYSEDESTKIFLCAGGDANDVSDDMKEFLEWLTTGKTGQCELVNNLDHAIQKARDHEEWRLEYMTLLMRDQEMMKKGRNEAIFSFVQDGIISLKTGADRANLSLQKFEEEMKKAGYTSPTKGGGRK